MKKIGVITFHESDNYGTCLQAYAVTKIVEQLGYDCEILNYKRKARLYNDQSIISKIGYILKSYGIRNIWMRNKVAEELKKQKKSFEAFRQSYLKYSSMVYDSFEDLQKGTAQYDAFVTGSDMVWSIDRSESLNIYFLRFADEKKRTAYAPSFGSAQISDELKLTYKKYLSEFPHLACREQSGVELIKDLTGRDACLTVDPTLACDYAVWDAFASEVAPNHPYILVYMFEGMPAWIRKTICKVAAHYQADILEVPMGARQWCDSIKNGRNVVGPKDFVALFKNAKFVFTNSYHGLMFSLIFHKQFYVVGRDTNGHWAQFEDRLTGILRLIGCEARVLRGKETIDPYEKIDYQKVSAKLADLKAASLDYFENALTIATNA